MTTDAEFLRTDVNMKKHVFKVMKIFSTYESTCSSHHKANELLKTYLGDPDVNRVRPMDGVAFAPIHYAVFLENLDLLELFKNSETVDVNIIYKKEGVEQGTILDLAVFSTKSKLEVIQKVLTMAKLKAYLPGPDQVAIPSVLDEAVRQDREDLLFLLLSSEATHPLLNHFSAAVSCIVYNSVRIFNKLLSKIQEQGKLYMPPPFLIRCYHCKGLDPSLLHHSLCYLKPKFLHCLLAAGHEARAVRSSTGLKPLQDALLCMKHKTTGPIQGGCNDGKCVQILGELLSDPNQDLFEEGQRKVELEEALIGEMCHQARRLLEKEVKKLSLRRKLETRRKMEDKEMKVTSDSQSRCWHCSASSGAVQLSKCASCRTAWYCGKSCQKEDWEKHWQWCEEREKERRDIKEQERRDKEQKKPKPYPVNSLAFELD